MKNSLNGADINKIIFIFHSSDFILQRKKKAFKLCKMFCECAVSFYWGLRNI